MLPLCTIPIKNLLVNGEPSSPTNRVKQSIGQTNTFPGHRQKPDRPHGRHAQALPYGRLTVIGNRNLTQPHTQELLNKNQKPFAQRQKASAQRQKVSAQPPRGVCTAAKSVCTAAKSVRSETPGVSPKAKSVSPGPKGVCPETPGVSASPKSVCTEGKSVRQKSSGVRPNSKSVRSSPAQKIFCLMQTKIRQLKATGSKQQMLVRYGQGDKPRACQKTRASQKGI